MSQIEDFISRWEVPMMTLASSFAASSYGVITYEDAWQELALLVCNRIEKLADYERSDGGDKAIWTGFRNCLRDFLARERRMVSVDAFYYDAETILHALARGLSCAEGTNYGLGSTDGTRSTSPPAERGNLMAAQADALRAYQSLTEEQQRVMFVAATQRHLHAADQAAILDLSEVAYRKAKSRNLGRMRRALNQPAGSPVGVRDVMSNREAIALTTQAA